MLLAPSFLAYLYFYNDRAYYLAAFAMVGMIGGLVWTLWGDNTARRLAFPIAYLLFMIPLPFIERWTLPLAMFTGVCSGAAVQLLGLDIEIIGNSVSLPNADLVIGAQCSGINSLIALMALSMLAAYLVEGAPWARDDSGLALVSAGDVGQYSACGFAPDRRPFLRRRQRIHLLP